MLNGNFQPCHVDFHLWWNCWGNLIKSYLGISRPEPRWFITWAVPSGVVFWYSAFLLKSLKLDDIASSHCALHHSICTTNASSHRHRLTNAFILVQECGYPIPPWMCLGDLIAICCFYWSWKIGYTLRVEIECVITLKPHRSLVDRIVDPSSSFYHKYHTFVAQLSHRSLCQLTILMGLVIVIDPYDPPPTTIICGNKGIKSQITHEPLGPLVLDMIILVSETMPYSLCWKLSRGLVMIGCRAFSNCNLILNYAGPLRCFLTQNLQDGRHISFVGN
jgi:hypothetical protein